MPSLEMLDFQAYCKGVVQSRHSVIPRDCKHSQSYFWCPLHATARRILFWTINSIDSFGLIGKFIPKNSFILSILILNLVLSSWENKIGNPLSMIWIGGFIFPLVNFVITSLISNLKPIQRIVTRIVKKSLILDVDQKEILLHQGFLH